MSSLGDAQEFEREMQRKTFCNPYLLDRVAICQRNLTEFPFLPDNLVTEMLPRLRLIPETGEMNADTTAPELFTERLMQVKLDRFWRECGRKQNSPYDPTQAQQRYEQFCSEFLPTLPPALSLTPDRKWDSQLPKLPMQRQLLYISIFDSVAWNFRPLLLLNTDQIAKLPQYKRVLLQSQKQKLAQAALEVLTAVSNLHSMFGGGHTRFAAIIFNSFEAPVLLLIRCSQSDFPFDQAEQNLDIVGLQVPKLTRCKTIQAVEKALTRLEKLSTVSDMAASGARVVSKLLAKVNALFELATPDSSNSSSLLPGSFPDMLGVGGDIEHGSRGFSEGLDPHLVAELFETVGTGNDNTGLQFPDWDVPTDNS
ncbi:hypothetical protein BDW62DRAFT_61094 [Aspergillus aurantiobrunneus]